MRYLVFILPLLLLIAVGVNQKSERAPSSIIKRSNCPQLLTQLYYSSPSFNQLFLGTKAYHQEIPTIGTEVEFLVNNSEKNEIIVKYVEKKLHDLLGVEVISNHAKLGNIKDAWTLEYVYKGRLHSMQVLNEVQHGVPEGYRCVEFNTPIMNSDFDRKIFSQVIAGLESTGAQTWSRGAGIHIHYGTPEIDTHELRLIYHTFASISSQLEEFFAKSPQRMFVKSLSGNQDIYADPKTFTNNVLKIKNSIIFYKPSTQSIELRIANSSFNSKVYDYAYQILSSIIDAVRKQDQQFLNLIKDNYFTSKGKMDMKTLFEVLEIDEILNDRSFTKALKKEIKRSLPWDKTVRDQTNIPQIQFPDDLEF